MLLRVVKAIFADHQVYAPGCLLVLVVLTAQPLQAGNIWLPGTGGISNVSVETIRERKFNTIVRQQYDFSCGSAALATLLTYHYQQPTSEQAVFAAMYEKGDQAKIRKEGFSLLDIKTYLASEGFQADGYQSNLETLTGVGVPAIALVNVRGYRHFVVVKGVENNNVLVGDPALGLRSMTRRSFEAMWENGILFIIRTSSEAGRQGFNVGPEWSLIARAPLGQAINRESLESLSVSLPRLGDVAL